MPSDVTPPVPPQRKLATKAGYMSAMATALVLLIAILGGLIDPQADWPPAVAPVVGVVVYGGVRGVLAVSIDAE